MRAMVKVRPIYRIVKILGFLPALVIAVAQAQTQAPFKNPYAILGLTKSATADEVKATYRKLIMSLHPDKSGANYDHEKFLAVTEAFNQIKAQPAPLEPDPVSAPAAKPFRTPKIVSLENLSVREILARDTRYLQFRDQILATIMRGLPRGRIFESLAYEGADLRFYHWRNNPVFFTLPVLGGVVVTMFDDIVTQALSASGDIVVGAVVAIALEQFSIRREKSLSRAEVAQAAQTFQQTVNTLNSGEGSRIKVALLNFDLAFAIVNQTKNKNGPFSYFNQLSRVMDYFPGSREGLLLRAVFNSGLLELEEPLLLDLAARSRRWRTIIAEAKEDVGPQAQPRITEWLANNRLRLPARVRVSRDKFCERWLQF